jgi:hypothetical protein
MLEASVSPKSTRQHRRSVVSNGKGSECESRDFFLQHLPGGQKVRSLARIYMCVAQASDFQSFGSTAGLPVE